MSITKKLKLYRIKTAFDYIPESWRNSIILREVSQRNRLSSFLSLLYWFYLYGFDFNDYCTFRFWQLTHTQRKSYISLKRNDSLRFKLSTPGAYKIFLDKALFNEKFRKYIHRDWKELSVTDPMSDLNKFLSEHKNVILKPLSDYGGHGVKKISNGSLSATDSISLEGDKFIVEECIENNENLKSIAPGSLNTIRIVTLIDKTGKLNILACVLRMGNGKSFTDNYHDGGLACAIDADRGELRGNAHGMNNKEYTHHPFSTIKFDGFKIEKFEQCLSLVKDLSKVVPEARYVGWDLAITPTGIDVIEGNIPPGEDITQIAAGRGLWYEVSGMI